MRIRRQALSHLLRERPSPILLFHEPFPAMDDLGCRRWNADIEDEATWLESVLLVPEGAALAVARGR